MGEKKFIGLVRELITEMKKKQILIFKLGLNQIVAQKLTDACGSLSVWMANKFIDFVLNRIQTFEPSKYITKHDAVNFINNTKLNSATMNQINSIMDWIRVGLNGNLGDYKNLDFFELSQKSDEWHDSLSTGQGQINYTEQNPIIRDYRDGDYGFYWADLQTNDSNEECNRMGHCGRTYSLNNLISLRENINLNQKFSLNKSHLTGAIGKNDGILYQLKGPKNSKPDESYHPFIVDLLINTDLIKGFGCEYGCEKDFKLKDLNEEQIKKLFEVKPDLFNKITDKLILSRMGLIDFKPPNTKFVLSLKPDGIGDFVYGDFSMGAKKTPNGGVVRTYFIEEMLTSDISEVIGLHGTYTWQDGLWMVNNENEQKIRELLNKDSQSSDFESHLEDFIENYDSDFEIRNIIHDAMEISIEKAHYDYFLKKLRETLSEIGTVIELDRNGAKIEVNVLNLGTEELVLNTIDQCDGDLYCVLNTFLEESRPTFNFDELYQPPVNKTYFNRELSELLEQFH